MPVDLTVFPGTHRVVLVRFGRSGGPTPDAQRPDVDDRGNGAPDRMPNVGLTQGLEIDVDVLRVRLDESAPLVVTSSDPATFAVVQPADGVLPTGARATVRLRGVRGGSLTRRAAQLDVSFGALADTNRPRIASLQVVVWEPLELPIMPVFFTVTRAGGASVSTAATRDIVASALAIAETAWRTAGVRLTIYDRPGGATETLPLLARSGYDGVVVGQGHTPTELIDLFARGRRPPAGTFAMPMYFVPELRLINEAGVERALLGLTIMQASAAGFGLAHPAMIIADRDPDGVTMSHFGRTFAHELGHFFGLEHPELGNETGGPPVRHDTWSHRMLMHNFNLLPPSPDDFRADVGWGSRVPGFLLTIQHHAQLQTDGEVGTLRTNVWRTFHGLDNRLDPLPAGMP